MTKNLSFKFTPSNSGFTLIETLVYLVLFGILMGGLLSSAYSIIEASGRNQTNIALQEEGNFLLGKFAWALSGARSIAVASNPPVLSITKYNLSHPLMFDTDSYHVRLTQGADSAYLNSDSIQVINILFQDIPAINSKPEGVSISFSLQTKTPNGALVSREFMTTQFLRK